MNATIPQYPLKPKVDERCNCSICRTTVDEALNNAFVAWLFGDIDDETHYNLTTYLKSIKYDTAKRTTSWKLRPCAIA